jgi:cyclic pyranopterin phosphate synthase
MRRFLGTLSHLSVVDGAAVSPAMVDIGRKSSSARFARAEAWLRIVGGGARVQSWWPDEQSAESALVTTAVVAGVSAAKACGALIPMCHPLSLTRAAVVVERPRLSSVDGRADDAVVRVVADASAVGSTGVEMEALLAASVAALTLVDMLKGALPPGSLEIEHVRLLEKTGGSRGAFKAATLDQAKQQTAPPPPQ